jgi:hypothetical protein
MVPENQQVTELKEQYKRIEKKTDAIDWKRVKSNETLYISYLFDVCEWWTSVGRKEHRLIYFAVPLIISLPSHNGFQERIFSACTWFDSPLRQRLKDKQFEMAVLFAFAVNESLLACEVPSDEKAKEMVDKVIATFEKDITFDASADLGLDPLADTFVEE